MSRKKGTIVTFLKNVTPKCDVIIKGKMLSQDNKFKYLWGNRNITWKVCAQY